MKLTHWYLAALAPLAIAGWSGAFFGQFAVLALTLGIFFSTLSLGRTRLQVPAGSSAETASGEMVPAERDAQVG